MRVSDDGRMFSPLTEAMDERQALPQLTVRAVVAGLLVGSMHCFINVYFGLQTGWVTMGSIQCAVVGYALFQLPMLRSATRFNSLENVVLQTVGVATATMPLAGGFVGIIPALGMLDPPVVLSVWQQVVWAAGLTYFGIFFAVPLRRQTILVEQLTFPSGTATAKLIETLHAKHERISGYGPTELDTSRRWRILSCAFVSSFLVAAIGFVFPFLANIDVGAVVGRPSLAAWHWTLRPSLSYIGQGMIMRQRPAFSMLGGALTAWAVLGPMARRNGWATGDIDSWEDGVQGWVLWVAMGLLLAEALTSFSLILLQQVSNTVVKYSRSLPSGPTDDLDPAPLKEQVPTAWWAGGLLASIVLSIGVVSPMFNLPVGQVLLAVCLSCVIAILAVRALGQTDLNPVSAVGKLSQVVFAFVAPGHVVANIVAGALAEAGATQAGDLLQDLKTGHLLGCSPRAQYYAQLIGATASIFVTVAAYQLYDHVYGIPSAQFSAPVAHVWKDMAILMQQGSSALPESAVRYASGFAIAGATLSVIEHCSHSVKWIGYFLPSGVGFGVGMYVTPDWTIPRVVGAIVELTWRRRDPNSHDKYMLMVASGFVLGEGVWSILQLALKAMLH